MAKYIGRDGIKKGKLGKELFYYAFDSNLVRELPIDSPSINTEKNIITKAKFASTMKFTDYCSDEALLKFFPDIKDAKMKRSSILKQNKKNFLPMPKKYYKISSLISFGDFSIPGSQETKIRTDVVEDTVLGENNMFQGMLVAYECFDYIQPTVANVSTWITQTYPVFHEGDYVHVYAMLCENCLYKNLDEDPISVNGHCRKKYIHRSFRIDTHDNTELSKLGLALAQQDLGDFITAYKVILIPLYNKYKVFRSNILMNSNPGVCYYWISTSDTTIHLNGGVKSVENTVYHSIKEKLKTDGAKQEILKSWKVVNYPIIN